MLAKMAADTYAMEAVGDLGCLLADRGKSDIRLEAAIGKLWNTDLAWLLCDDAMQIRGGRGYETAPSLALRGEPPIPLERAMRDLRINRIFEGSNQVMRLFIAREALDVHLKVAGDVVMPNVPMDKRLAGLVRARGSSTPAGIRRAGSAGGAGRSTPSSGAWPITSAGSNACRAGCRARSSISWWATARRSSAGRSELFRAVDAGAELFAMIATCCRAQRDTKKGIGDGGAINLADTFCKASRRRIEALFAAIESNDDVSNYEVSRDPWWALRVARGRRRGRAVREAGRSRGARQVGIPTRRPGGASGMAGPSGPAFLRYAQHGR